MIQDALEHLKALVAFDTRNPPREITTEGIFSYIREHLTDDFEVETVDLGDGCIYLHAHRGTPKLLINVHLDTVPVADGWETDPHKLTIKENRAYGLGAADIKGAAALLLQVIHETQGDIGLLFSSDEEAGQSTCIRQFTQRKSDLPYEKVMVCEPSECKATIAHRGIATSRGYFSGTAGHASEARALKDSAVHQAALWATQALSWAEQRQKPSVQELKGLPFNIGKFTGGQKANMIADTCEVHFGFRPLPGQDADALLEELWACAADPNRARFEKGFMAPPCPAPVIGDPAATQQRYDNNKALAEALDIPVGPAVSFWTEASLFSEVDYPVLVFGPGAIAQAHTANEWVSLAHLEDAYHTFKRVIQNTPLKED
mgnify:CR=1 FL=1